MVDYNDSENIELRKNQEDPIIMYLIVREKLGMSIGKTAAQCAHAAQMLQLKYGKLEIRLEELETIDKLFGMLNEEERNEWDKKHPNYYQYLEWLEGSFRKVVLRANENEWQKIKTEFTLFDKEMEYMALVVDAGLTEVEPNTETVIGLWPMKKSVVPKLIKRLQVLK